jgi:glycine hydroxymethyltransferase
LRIGTPAITTRGFQVSETAQLTNWIADVLDVLHNEEQTDVVTKRVRREAIELCSRFPVYEEG